MRIQVEVWSGREEWERHWDEWEALRSADPHATCFQSPAWLVPWARHLARGEPFALALRDPLDGGRLHALIPLERRSMGRVRFAGSGVSDYQGSLELPGRGGATAELLQAWLLADGSWVRCLDGPQAPAELSARAPETLGWRRIAREYCPYLALPESEEALAASLPRGLRKNLRSARNRLRLEGFRVECVAQETLQEFYSALFALHGARWRSKGLPGVFGSARVRRFHEDAGVALLASGELQLLALRDAAGVIRAAHLGYLFGGRCAFYASGFDPALRALSPGGVLILSAMEAAIRDGCRGFDFLRGGEAYKYRWGAVNRTNVRLLWGRGFLGKGLATVAAWETVALREAARQLGRQTPTS